MSRLAFVVTTRTLVLGIVCILNLADCLEIPSCCPDGYVFRDLSCSSSLKSDRVRSVSGYLIKGTGPNGSNIPVCSSHLEQEITTGSSVLISDSCIMSKDDRYYSITCPPQGFFQSVSVNIMKKCCPKDQYYDTQSRNCMPSNRSAELFKNILDRPTILEYNNFTCPNDTVTVKYFSRKFDFSFKDSELLVDDNRFDSNSYCLEAIVDSASDSAEVSFVARVCRPKYVCNDIICARRCCGDQSKMMRIDNVTQCVHHNAILDVEFYNIQINSLHNMTVAPVAMEVYGLSQSLTCMKYSLQEDNYVDYKSGMLVVQEISGIHEYDISEYCIEYAVNPVLKKLSFVCADKPPKFKFFPYLNLISSLFLLVTALVYISIPKLFNLHGKTLTCYVLCLFVAYILLAWSQLKQQKFIKCAEFGYCLYFSFMAAFSWLNTMCFDIYWTFGSVERAQGLKRSNEWRKFFFYSLYAWLAAIFFTTITAVIDRNDIVKGSWSPNFGATRCWFKDTSGRAHLLFFLLPMGIFLLTNLILFILTMRYCNRVKNEIQRMQSSNIDKRSMKKRFAADKAKFAMTSKLFIVMGISWILEILSTILYQHEAIFYVIDSFNTLQGFLIFIIFVFKKRVWDAIKQRFGLKPKKKYHLGGTTIVGGTTATTTLTGSTDQLRMGRVKSVENCSLLNSNAATFNNVRNTSPT